MARPSTVTTARPLRGAENDGQEGGWSQVNDGWHGDPPPASWVDYDLNFGNSTWQLASEFGLNGELELEADCGDASNFARRMIMAEGRRLMRHTDSHGHGLGWRRPSCTLLVTLISSALDRRCSARTASSMLSTCWLNSPSAAAAPSASSLHTIAFRFFSVDHLSAIDPSPSPPLPPSHSL